MGGDGTGWGAVVVWGGAEEGAAAYDIAFLDLLGVPAQLGLLRARGLITGGTVTVMAFADHRVASEGELRRRCGFWRVMLAGDGDAVTMDRSAKKELTPAGHHAGSSRARRGLGPGSPNTPSCGWPVSRT